MAVVNISSFGLDLVARINGGVGVVSNTIMGLL